MTVLNDLITAVTNPEHQDADARHAAVTALLDQGKDIDLSALETEAVTAWHTANGEMDVLNLPADLAADTDKAEKAVAAHMVRMHQLADLVHAVRTRRQSTVPPVEPAPKLTTPQGTATAPEAPEPATATPPAEPVTETPAAAEPAADTAAAPAAEPVAETPPAAAPPPAAPAAPTVVPAEPAGAAPDAAVPAPTSPPAVQPEVPVSAPTAADPAPAVEPAPVAVAASSAVVPTSSTTAVPVTPPLSAADNPVSEKAIMDWAGMAFDTGAVVAGGGQQGGGYTITASAQLPNGLNLGDQISGLPGLADALLARTSQLARGVTDPMPHILAKATAADHARAYDSIQRVGTSSIALPAAARQFVMRDIKDDETLEMAANEHRLPGGSLTAAIVNGTPGWCAPAEQRLEFCPPEVAEDLLDLPTVITPRGAIQYPIEPDFSVLYSTPNLGWCYPHEAYEDPDPPVPGTPGPLNKPCIDVPCPQHETTELDPCGICIRARILLATAFPEAVQKFMARALVAWTLKQNCRNISGILTKIGAANTITVPQLVTGPGATASILEVLEFYRLQLIYRHMLSKNITMEVLLPLWLRAVIRADISKREGWDNISDAVADSRIDAMILARGVRPQWIRGLSEAYCDPAQGTTPNIPTSTLFGGGANILGTPANAFAGGAGSLWPATVPMVMYPAGTFVRGRLGLVNIENGLVDSALLARNERMLLFLEEANAIIKRCYQGLIINVPICASGQTGGAGLTPGCGQPVTP